MMLFVLRCGPLAPAQDIHIRVVNGRNGKPVTGECLNVWIGTGRESHLVAGTNKDGIAVLHVGNANISAETPCQGWPTRVSAHSDEIRVTGDLYVACQEYGKQIPGDTATDPVRLIPSHSIRKIVESGVAVADTCGKQKAVAKPGELILFARPMSFWEKMKL
jgi:hypothetical protein